MRLLFIGIATLALVGCSTTGEDNQALTFAMEACSITLEVDDGSGGETYSFPEKGEGDWGLADPLNELREIYRSNKTRATAASSASKLDAVWRPLADALSSNASFVDSVISWREAHEYEPISEIFKTRPDINDQGAEYNSNNDFWDTECQGLVQLLNS